MVRFDEMSARLSRLSWTMTPASVLVVTLALAAAAGDEESTSVSCFKEAGGKV